MRVTLLRDILVFLLLCSAPRVAARTRSISLLVCVFVSVAFPRRLFGAGRALCLQERDETSPVKHRGAPPQMRPEPVLFASHFSSATGTIPLHRSAATSTSSSKRRRPNSTSFSAFGATPRIAACSENVRPRSTRAFRSASPRCQRSLASELTWPSPLQKSQVISPVRHPRSLKICGTPFSHLHMKDKQ